MAEEEKQPIDRRKRVKRLKRYIIVMLLVGMAVPWIVCGVLVGCLYADRKEVKELGREYAVVAQRLEQLEGLITGLQKKEESQLSAEEKGALLPGACEQQAETAQDPEVWHEVYLTFDDGPSVYTQDILDILEAYDVKATFFVVGKTGERNEEMLRRIVDAGHSLGMHSYSHRYEDIYKSVDAFAADTQEIRTHILQITGVDCKLYRFPGGSSNRVTDVNIREFGEYLRAEGITYFDWNISSGDAGRVSPTAEEIVQRCTQGITDRKVSVILMHDTQDKISTLEALPQVIEGIRAIPGAVLLPLTEDTEPVQHIKLTTNE